MAKREELRGSSIELARLLAITDRRVRQLAETKTLTRQAEGDFILPEAIAEYYSYKYQTEETIDYMTEKARHEKAKRELAELELRKRMNEVHDADNVKIIMGDMLSNLRSQLLGLPAKMAPVLANRDAGYIALEMTKEIEDRLTELSDYRPDLFSDEAMERKEEDGE